jgi:hypothetical protein
VGRAEDQNRQGVEEVRRGRKHQATIFGTRRTDGWGVDALLARMAQANAIRQTHRLRFPISSEEGQDSDLFIGILPRSPKTSGEKGWGCDPRRTSLGSAQPPAQPVELAGEQAKENPKTVQGILGHSRIQTTLDLYTDEDLDEMIAAQEKFLDAVGFESGSVQ